MEHEVVVEDQEVDEGDDHRVEYETVRVSIFGDSLHAKPCLDGDIITMQARRSAYECSAYDFAQIAYCASAWSRHETRCIQQKRAPGKSTAESQKSINFLYRMHQHDTLFPVLISHHNLVAGQDIGLWCTDILEGSS